MLPPICFVQTARSIGFSMIFEKTENLLDRKELQKQGGGGIRRLENLRLTFSFSRVPVAWITQSIRRELCSSAAGCPRTFSRHIQSFFLGKNPQTTHPGSCSVATIESENCRGRDSSGPAGVPFGQQCRPNLCSVELTRIVHARRNGVDGEQQWIQPDLAFAFIQCVVAISLQQRELNNIQRIEVGVAAG